MESDINPLQDSIFHDLQDSGKTWSGYYRPNHERISYGLLGLLYVLILALFITVFTRSSGNLQLVSKKEVDDFSIKVSALSSEMEQLESTFQRKKCDKEWVQFENSCYFISKSQSDWTAARSMCQGKQSDLLVISNNKEQLFIADKTKPTSYRRYWLGLHDTHEEGLWKWVDGTNYEASYKAWTKGEPNDHLDEEDCALMWTNGEWNDVPCDYDNSYTICERPL